MSSSYQTESRDIRRRSNRNRTKRTGSGTLTIVKVKRKRKRFGCTKCSCKIFDRNSYEIHWDEQHQEVDRCEMYPGGIPCAFCPRYFQYSIGLENHLRRIHGLKDAARKKSVLPKKKSLSKVQQAMMERQRIANGFRNKHGKIKWILCRKCTCKISDYSEDKYDQHWQEKHSELDRTEMYDDGGVLCTKCPRRFRNKQALVKHEWKMHMKRMPYPKVEPRREVIVNTAVVEDTATSVKSENSLTAGFFQIFEPNNVKTKDMQDGNCAKANNSAVKEVANCVSSAVNDGRANLPKITIVYSVSAKQ